MIGPFHYEFVEKFDHHYSFQVYDKKGGRKLWRISFKTIPEAQSLLPEGATVDWGECIRLVDLNEVKTKINREKLEKAMGFDADRIEEN